MKISKFGGTSVGTPERIKNVSLLINDGTKRIVVCSAMSQTTNSLFEICDYYSKDNFDGAHTVISNLEKKYVKVINELLQTERFREKAKEIILAEFKDIRNFANKPFSIVVEKSIVARGEILSTNLIQL